jgi:hypothetical protein
LLQKTTIKILCINNWQLQEMVSSDASAASANVCPDTFNIRQWSRRSDVGMVSRDVHTFKQAQFNV